MNYGIRVVCTLDACSGMFCMFYRITSNRGRPRLKVALKYRQQLNKHVKSTGCPPIDAAIRANLLATPRSHMFFMLPRQSPPSALVYNYLSIYCICTVGHP